MRRKAVRMLVVSASALYMIAQMNAAAKVYGNTLPVVRASTKVTVETSVYRERSEIEMANLGTAGRNEAVSAEPTEPVHVFELSADESEVLKKIAMAEAEGEDTEGKALVMLVVLNRAHSDGFPDSIEDVVLQSYGGVYQFSPVIPGGRYWTAEPSADCDKALEMVLSGWDESDGALFFESCDGPSWQSENLEFLFSHGGHRFYR